jgi:hypothetical protein
MILYVIVALSPCNIKRNNLVLDVEEILVRHPIFLVNMTGNLADVIAHYYNLRLSIFIKLNNLNLYV